MGKVKKEVRSAGRSLDRRVRGAFEKIDRTIGVKAQKDILQRELGNLAKTVTGVPKIVQETTPTGVVDRQAARPLAAVSQSGDNQEEATRELYRRRRARGVATSSMGLTGPATVKRKTLLGN